MTDSLAGDRDHPENLLGRIRQQVHLAQEDLPETRWESLTVSGLDGSHELLNEKGVAILTGPDELDHDFVGWLSKDPGKFDDKLLPRERAEIEELSPPVAPQFAKQCLQ